MQLTLDTMSQGKVEEAKQAAPEHPKLVLTRRALSGGVWWEVFWEEAEAHAAAMHYLSTLHEVATPSPSPSCSPLACGADLQRDGRQLSSRRQRSPTRRLLVHGGGGDPFP